MVEKEASEDYRNKAEKQAVDLLGLPGGYEVRESFQTCRQYSLFIFLKLVTDYM